MLNILHFPFPDDGCTWYRHVIPTKALKEQELARIYEITPDMPDQNLEKLLKMGDVLHVRAAQDRLWQVYDIARESNPNILIVADTDDDLTDLHPHNNSYESMGQQEVKMPEAIAKAKGREWMWRHGEGGFDLRMNRHRMVDYLWALHKADLVTTTTPLLAERLRSYYENVAALPNALHPAHWAQDVPRRHDGKVRILWSGGSSHMADLKMVSQTLINLLKKYPQVELHFQGQHFPAFEKWFGELRGKRYFHHSWVKPESLGDRLAVIGADIGICPLEDTEFNAAKSCVKFYEYSAAGMATVASGVEPYSSEIQQEKTGLLADPDHFMEAIEKLINDPVYRVTMANQAREWVWKHRNALDVAKDYVKVFEAAVKAKKEAK
jgi:glycosyltransferase involved in cell wall biosynthesis